MLKREGNTKEFENEASRIVEAQREIASHTYGVDSVAMADNEIREMVEEGVQEEDSFEKLANTAAFREGNVNKKLDETQSDTELQEIVGVRVRGQLKWIAENATRYYPEPKKTALKEELLARMENDLDNLTSDFNTSHNVDSFHLCL